MIVLMSLFSGPANHSTRTLSTIHVDYLNLRLR